MLRRLHRQVRRRRVQVALGAVAVLVAAFFLVPLDDDEEAPPPLAATTPTPTAEPTPVVRTDSPLYDGPRTVIHLPREPIEVRPDRVASLGPKPEPLFPEWGGESVVLYDLESSEMRDLGPGRVWLSPFSPDSTKLVWLAGTSPTGMGLAVQVMDLETARMRRYATGARASFEGDALAVWEGAHFQSTARYFDLESGELIFRDRTPVTAGLLSTERLSVVMTIQHPDGYRVQTVRQPTGSWVERSIVIAPDGAAFELPDATVLRILPHEQGADVLAVASVPSVPLEVLNLYRVALFDGHVRLIAQLGEGHLTVPVVGLDYLAWTRDGCSAELGRTYVYEIGADRLTEIDEPLHLASWGGPQLAIAGAAERLALAPPRRAHALIDLDTLEYIDVMPGAPVRSGDGRWAVNAPLATYGPGVIFASVDPCAG